MKSIRSRLTVIFIGLIAVILAVIWGVNKWYLEDFYVSKKVQALNEAYTAIDSQIQENQRKYYGGKLAAPDPEFQRQRQRFRADHR